jgi:hypothetical protein
MGIGLIPDLVTSWLDHKAQKKAAKQVIGQYNDYQTGATNALTGARDASVAGYAPFLSGGQAQFQAAQNMLSPGYDYASEDPSFEFGLKTGIDALNRSASAGGTIGSGGAAKALMRFGTDYGTTKFGESFNRRNQLAQYGLQAAGGNAQAQGLYGREMSDVLLNAARGRSEGYLGKANAKSQLYGDITGAFENAASDFASLFGF